MHRFEVYALSGANTGLEQAARGRRIWRWHLVWDCNL